MDYLLILKIPIEAPDDPCARKKAKEIIDNKINIPSKAKLQRLKKNDKPEGISL